MPSPLGGGAAADTQRHLGDIGGGLHAGLAHHGDGLRLSLLVEADSGFRRGGGSPGASGQGKGEGDDQYCN